MPVSIYFEAPSQSQKG